jgi:hypothetical protein
MYGRRHFGGSREVPRFASDFRRQFLHGGRRHARRFRLEDDQFDVFTPIGQNTSPPNAESQGARLWRVGAAAARRHLAQAQTELAVVGQRLAQEYPDSNKGRTFIASR